MIEDMSKRDDPRLPLERRRRVEMLAYARRNGIEEIVENMPAKLMRATLRGRGVHDLDSPPLEPVLGARRGIAAPRNMPRPRDIDARALDDLKRQWLAEQSKGESFDNMKIFELRRLASERGIKFTNTTKATELKAMLHGQEDPS